MRHWVWLSAFGLLGALSGCAVGPDYQTPAIATPGAFLGQSATGMFKAAGVDLTQWWKSLHDRKLDSLVARAQEANYDLRIALYRLLEARAQTVVLANLALPTSGATAGGGLGTGSDETKGRATQPLRSAENSTGVKSVNAAGGADALWELDFFGKISREVESQNADAEAIKDARDWIAVTVAADVVRAYLDMRAQQRQLAVLGENISAARSSLDLAQTRFNRGLTNEMDVSLAQRQLAALQADQAPLAAQIDLSKHAIAILLGQYPEDLAKELAGSSPIPTLPGRIPVGLPIELLRQRPDIREAERRLAAATARIGSAIADLYPTVLLTGGAGAQGGPSTKTGVPIAGIWSIGPAIYAPILDFGALDAKIEIADLDARELLVGYKQAILTAVQQVDDAVTSYRAQQQRLGDLDRALAAARRATQLATERYDRGLTDFLNVLDAEREQFDLEQRHVAARQTEADDLVALYKALGAGWSPNAAVAPIRPFEPAVVVAVKHLLAPAQNPE